MSKLITQIKRLALALCFVTPLVSWAAAVGDTVTWTNADGLTADDVVNANHCSFSLELPETAGLAKGSVVRITNVQIASINSQRVSNSSNNQNDPHSISIGNTRSSEVSFITSETLAGKYIDSYDFANGVEVEVGKKYGESWGAAYTQFAGCGVTFLHSNGNRWSGGKTMNCTVGGTTAGAIANGGTVFPIYKITATVVAVAQNVERSIAANADTTWVAEEWTVGGTANQSFVPDSDTIYNVTITVGGDCTVTMPESIGSFETCNVNFVLDSGAQAATVTLKYAGTLPSDSATTANFSPFGSASVTAGEGVTLTPVYEEDTTGYVTQISGVNYYAAKRPNVGVVSVRIGARTEDPSGGNILNTPYSNVGPYPVSGLLWNQTKLWNDNSTSGTYTDIQNLADAKNGSSAVRIAYYGHNTYYNSNAATLPNMVLTKTYLDDSDSGNGNLTATDGTENITLPTPGHNRGWQLHFENIPYNAYDVYFITASDVENGNLKETPIYVSLDGGSTWKSYCGDSTNEKTVMGTDPWTGLPYAQNGVLVHGKNYIKMRITKSIYGDNIGTIDITHGTRNTGSSIRSGLAAIQIVEVQNDGVYSLQENGNWSGAIWTVGSLTGQTWTDTVEGEASIAKIASSETVSSVTVDQAVSAGSVILTGSNPFTVKGSSTLTVGTGFDASAFTGALNLQAPISGTIYIGANTDLAFGGDTDMTLPAYTLDGAGAWQKVGSGKLTVNSPLALAGTVNAGTVEFTSSTSGNLSLVGGDLVLAGGETELIYSGSASLADQGSGKTVVSSGVVQSTGSIATDIDVENGATLKLGAVGGFGSTGNGANVSGKTIAIKQGGTIELNGAEGCNAYTLAGGTLQNSGNAIPVTQRQTMGLTLTADSTVNAASNFGLVNSQYGVVSVALNGNTLTKTGANTFILCNVSTDNSGAIEVTEGTMSFEASASTLSVPVTVAQGAALNVAVASTVSSVDGEGSVTGSATLTVNDELDLTDGLTVAAPVALADGATVKFASASTITGAIASPASGTATLDVTALTATENVVLAPAASGLDVSKLTLVGAPTGAFLKVVDGNLTLVLKVTITVPAVANATATAAIAGEPITLDSNGQAEVVPGSVVTVTYEANDGYVISGTTEYTINTASETTFDPTGTTQVDAILATITSADGETITPYTSVATAFTEVDDDETLTLTSNYTLTENVEITKSFTLAGSDAVTVSAGGFHFVVTDDAEFTIADSITVGAQVWIASTTCTVKVPSTASTVVRNDTSLPMIDGYMLRYSTAEGVTTYWIIQQFVLNVNYSNCAAYLDAEHETLLGYTPVDDGSTIQFVVVPSEGYESPTVTANDTAVTPDGEGWYSVTVDGENVTLVISATAMPKITLPDMAGTLMTVTSVTIGGEPVEPNSDGTYSVPSGSTVVIAFTADASVYFPGDGTLTIENVTADTTVETSSLPVVAPYVAEVGGTKYATLQEAVDQGNVTVKILGDVTLTEKLIVDGGQTVVLTADSAVTVTGQLRVVDGSSCTIEENVTFTSASHPTVFVLGDPAVNTAGTAPSTLVVNGKVLNTNTGFDKTFAIAGNGLDTQGVNVTIGATGEVRNANGIAIYQAFPGNLVVSGTVAGASAISIKDGTLTVNDGASVTATLADGLAYVGNNNGETPTGDAIIAPYYPLSKGYGTPVVSIVGGTITVTDTTNCTGIEAYDFDGVEAPEDAATNVNVAGGEFNAPVAEDYCAAGFIPEDNGDGTYGVKEGVYVARVGGVGYETLQEAVDQGDVTVKILGDVTLPAKLIVDGGQTVVFTADSPVTVTGQLRVVDGSSCTIEENVTFTSASHPTVFVLGDPAVNTAGTAPSTLVVNGKVLNTNTGFDKTFAIAGNGLDTQGVNVTIGATGEVRNANGIAIYQAFPGNLVVSGTVAGASAISIKDGTLTVNDGASVTATLADGLAYVGNNNGETPTGDAIIAPYYPLSKGYGTPVVSIVGGTITVTDTTNCTGIEAYDFEGTTAPQDAATNVNVSGGLFNTPVAEVYCASGYIPCEVTGGYSVMLAPEPSGIDPTDSTSTQEVTPSEQEIADAGSAEAAAKAKATVTVPEAVATATGVTEETYKSYFTLSATETSPGSGVYEVAIVELNEAVVFPTSESDELTADLADVLDADTGDGVAITTAKPGLYYSIEAANSVDFATGKVEGERELAKTSTVSPAKPAKTGTAVFYRVKVSATPSAVVE